MRRSLSFWACGFWMLVTATLLVALVTFWDFLDDRSKARAKASLTFVQWEQISHYVHRTPVPGGWLVRAGLNAGVAVTFIADPEGEWHR